MFPFLPKGKCDCTVTVRVFVYDPVPEIYDTQVNFKQNMFFYNKTIQLN